MVQWAWKLWPKNTEVNEFYFKLLIASAIVSRSMYIIDPEKIYKKGEN